MEKHLKEELELKKVKIAKIFKFSNVDGPGNRMAIFFQGCNFNCKYCHNPETIPNTNLDSKMLSIKEIMDNLDKVMPFLEGVTVSGGEATLNYDFITLLFKEIKKKYPILTCYVDTNGGLDLSEDKFKEFIGIVDKFMLDIKIWDENKHQELTGVSNEIVIKNLEYLALIDKLYEARIVVLGDDFENYNETVKNVSEKIKNSNIKLKLISYRAHGVREEFKNFLKSPNLNDLEKLKESAKLIGVKNIEII